MCHVICFPSKSTDLFNSPIKCNFLTTELKLAILSGQEKQCKDIQGMLLVVIVFYCFCLYIIIINYYYCGYLAKTSIRLKKDGDEGIMGVI